jgi:transcriptional regulator with XRE-family HTH domain
MNTRLKQFLAAENISQSQFADTIRVVRASVSHVLSGRNNPSYEFIRAIMLSYPHLNMEWLLVGKGKMYKEASQAAVLPISEPAPSLSDLLFAEEMQDEPVQIATVSESPISLSIPDSEPSVKISNDINTTNNTTQVSVKQRKVSKIIVMYDDGTYQEM